MILTWGLKYVSKVLNVNNRLYVQYTESKEKIQVNKWLENMTATDHLGDSGVDGRIILGRVLTAWIDFEGVAYEMFRQGTLANALINDWVPYGERNFSRTISFWQDLCLLKTGNEAQIFVPCSIMKSFNTVPMTLTHVTDTAVGHTRLKKIRP
jgi:hypothetical protein